MARILKGNEVEIDGHFDLGAGGVRTKALEGAPGETTSQVSVVENGPQHTILAFVCSCGKTSYIRCEH